MKSIASKERAVCLSGDTAVLEFIEQAADKVAQMPAWKRGILKTLCEHIQEGALETLTPQTSDDGPILQSIAEACKVYREAFEKDPEFFQVYQANLAMLLYDHAGPQFKDPEFRDDIAARILKLLFWW